MPAPAHPDNAPQPDDLLRPSPAGLACEAGGFHVDPHAPVPLAVVTHAHADHATAGCGRYIATPATAALLRTRLGQSTPVEPLDFAEPIELGKASITLHPAGHVLGSAQVRVEPSRGPVWCVSGDYKVQHGRTCEAFEPVPSDVFVTESTFGIPIFRWADPDRVAADIRAWWRANADAGATSVLFAYSLGKAQRVLAALDPTADPDPDQDHPPGTIGVHGAVHNINRVYESLGVALPAHVHANDDTAPDLKGTGVIVAPPSQAGTPWLRKFAGTAGVRTAMVSGWMTIRGRRRWQSLDTGFVLSDHADWPGLLDAIDATGATRVGVTHGYTAPFARFLREHRGLDAFTLPTRWGDAGGGEDAD